MNRCASELQFHCYSPPNNVQSGYSWGGSVRGESNTRVAYATSLPPSFLCTADGKLGRVHDDCQHAIVARSQQRFAGLRGQLSARRPRSLRDAGLRRFLDRPSPFHDRPWQVSPGYCSRSEMRRLPPSDARRAAVRDSRGARPGGRPAFCAAVSRGLIVLGPGRRLTGRHSYI
jgi:hypothetical protein